MITSTKNPKIKFIHDLQSSSKKRREGNVFVVEGKRLAEEALNSGWSVKSGIVTGIFLERNPKISHSIEDLDVSIDLVSEAVMKHASDTKTPQGILFVVKREVYSISEHLNFIVIGDTIRDPGNLGALLRSAAGAGVQAIFLTPETTDPFAPKVIRGGMGAHFRLPILIDDWDGITHQIKNHDLKVYLAAANQGESYTTIDFRNPTALIIGGEAEGASQAAQQIANTIINIYMPGGVESLNAAVAGAILMFEVVRKREMGN